MSPSARFRVLSFSALLALRAGTVGAEVTGSTTISGLLRPFQRSLVTTVLTNDGPLNEGDLAAGSVNFRQFIPELLEVDRVTATGGSVRMRPVIFFPGFEGTTVEWNGVVCGTQSACPRTVTIVAEVFPRLGSQNLFFDTFADVIFPASDPSPSPSNTAGHRVTTQHPVPLATLLATRGNQVLAKPCGVAASELVGGAGLVSADFDSDGYDDLAVGIPRRTVSSVAGAGAVCVMHGGPTAFSPPSRVAFLHNDVPSVSGAVQAQGGFGQALTAGDFNGDGFADLAVGAPLYDNGPTGADSGGVWVFFGSSTGLRAGGSRSFTQSTFPGHAPESGDRFGHALAAGDFDADGLEDLAMSAPFEDLASATDAGVVHLAQSVGSGNALFLPRTLLGQGTRVVTDDVNGVRTVVEVPETGDRYGWALAAGNLRGGAGAELAVSAPFETVADAGNQATGVVEVYEFSTSAPLQVYAHQGTQGAMRFGTALAMGDLNVDDFDELLVASEETVGGAERAGSLGILARTPAVGVHFHSYRMPVTLNQGAIMNETPQAADLFAAVLAVGDFNGDGVSDLALGVPGENLGLTANVGIVHALYSFAGFAPAGARQRWGQELSGMGEAAEASDIFGAALAAGDFDGDGFDDLAIGVPGEEIVGGATDQGVIQVLFGGGGR